MRRFLAAWLCLALVCPSFAGEIKTVPEIKAEVNPGGPSASLQTPQLSVVPNQAIPNLAPAASVIAPELNAQPVAAVPTMQPSASQINPAPELKLIVQPKADAVSPQQSPTVGENESGAGQVQFDQARAISQNLSVGTDGGLINMQTGAPRLQKFSGDDNAPARGPPSAGSDGESSSELFSKVLDRAVAKGTLTPKLRDELLDAAYRDQLTGLYNRLYLDTHKDAMTRNYRTLATFKLDSLKEINDSYDHETGNKFIKAVAALGEQVVGDEGVVVRRSPTGFAVFLDAPASDARMAAEALRIAVSRKIGDPSKLVAGAPRSAPGGTISVGVSAFDNAAPPQKAWTLALQKAEDARMLAKEQGGGDRVAYDDGDSKLMDRRTLEEAVSVFRRTRREKGAKRLQDVDAKDLPQILRDHDSTVPNPGQMAEIMERLKDPEVRKAAFSVVYRDRLSGLLNRRYLFDHLENLLTGYNSYMALDLDKFGDLNAALGEDKADLIIKELGNILNEGVKQQSATPLHLSGEEFVVLGGQRQLDPKALGEVLRLKVKNELGRTVAEKYGIVNPDTGKPYEITISIGVAPIRPQAGAPDQRLALVTAMAESLLQRAKAGGRDRVEVGAEGLTALLSRIVRVDETVRQAVDAMFKPSSRPATGSAFFDNSFKSRAEVLSALKFNPGAEPGTLLSEPEKGNSATWLVSPKGRPKQVVKISDMEVVSNEALLRGVVESFEIFNTLLASPKSVAYKRIWPFKPVLVQEYVANAHKGRMDSRNLPLRQKVALALLANTFGVHGFNPGAFLDVNFDRSVIVDFEFSRAAFEVSNAPLPIGAGSFHPYVAENYLNDMGDYALAISAWRKTFKKPETQAELRRLMRRAGIPEARIDKDLAVFAQNLAILDKGLARAIATGNRDFRESAKRAGLDEAQTRSLSFVNKSAHTGERGGIFRDITRLLNHQISRGSVESKEFALRPEEWAQLKASRADGLTGADREAVIKTAYEGKLGYDAAAVRSALRQIEWLLNAP